MIKSGFSYLKLTAVVAVLAITLIPSVRPSTATKQPPPLATAASGADLANEERALAKYFDDLVAYDKQTAQLSAKAKLFFDSSKEEGEAAIRKRSKVKDSLRADLDLLQRRSDDLKGRLSGLQNIIAEIVKKLKAANEWNDLDAKVAAGITDASQKSFFQQESFKQLLVESSTNLTSHKNEISIPVDNLRKKLTSRMLSPYGDGADLRIVRAAYEAPGPVAFVSLACTVGRIRLGLIQRLGGTPSAETVDRVTCACGGTGAVCATL